MNTQKGMTLPVIIGLFVVLAVISGVWYFNARPEGEKMMDMGEEMMKDGESMMKDGEEMMKDGEEMMKDGEAMMEKEDGAMMESEGSMEMEASAGVYEEYAAGKVASADGDVVLFFHATWCPTCRALDNDITRSLGDIPSDLTILKTDFDQQTALKQQYGVTLQHTLVQVDSSGNLVKKWTGSENLESIVAQVQ